LVKPQFEAGREAVGKGGIVRDETARAKAVARVREFIERISGWTVIGETPSPVPGSDGNIETLIGAHCDAT
jgi:23S rRNA (cytidine1920-2'-O)/16S rRNA (cytidine1409-2'-O)-methyltransferase